MGQEADLSSLISELGHQQWEVRQRAADSLRRLGHDAADALPELRSALYNDSDYDVRESALGAIAAIDADHAAVLADLEKGLSDPWANVRTRAAREFADLRGVREEAVERLWSFLGRDDDRTVTEVAVRSLEHLASPREVLASALDRLASGNEAQVRGAIAVLWSTAEPIDAGQLEAQAPEALRTLGYVPALYELGWLLVRNLDAATVERLVMDDPQIDQWKRGELLAGDYEDRVVAGLAQRRPDDVISAMLATLDLGAGGHFDAALALLGRHGLIARMDPAQHDALESAVFRAVEQGLGVQHLAALGDPVATLRRALEMVQLTPTLVESMVASDLVDQYWADLSDPFVGILAMALDHPSGYVRERAADLVRTHARDVVRHARGRDIAQKLEALPGRQDVDQRAAQLALTELRQEQRSTRTDQLVEVLRTGDDSARIETVNDILGDSTPEATRALVHEFATWIACEEGQIVEVVGEAIRSWPSTVLPLLDQWDRGLELDDHVRARLVEVVVPRDLRADVCHLLDGQELPRPRLREIRDWIGETHPSTPGPMPADPTANGNLTERQRGRAMAALTLEMVTRVLNEECAKRALAVRRRFARLLADMSDERFFEESEREKFDAITRQLRRHAVRILGRRLATEQDITTRESIARALGNLGGREAVDVLTRAIVDDERTKASRQDLLARYYLEPSKARSDEAAQILHGAVAEAKRTLLLLQILNALFFLAALAVTIVGAVIVLRGDHAIEIVGGTVTTLAGIVGIVIQVLREPLVRIQNAVTRLVQVETAFASFIWELNLNGTYIQSQYVADGRLEDEHIARTVGRIENAMHLAMDLVARYAEEGGSAPAPRLTAITPTSARGGTQLVLRGMALLPPSSNGAAAGIVAIDHVPIAAKGMTWHDDRIEFALPDDVVTVGPEARTVWVNAVVNGMETNALPLLVAAPPAPAP
jgi:HEAT repeat protein